MKGNIGFYVARKFLKMGKKTSLCFQINLQCLDINSHQHIRGGCAEKHSLSSIIVFYEGTARYLQQLANFGK